jgi:hypothetical protein
MSDVCSEIKDLIDRMERFPDKFTLDTEFFSASLFKRDISQVGSALEISIACRINYSLCPRLHHDWMTDDEVNLVWKAMDKLEIYNTEKRKREEAEQRAWKRKMARKLLRSEFDG